MTVRRKDMTRVFVNIKKTSEWRNRLISANNLFHQGSSQYSAAVNQYGKIIETLLRDLFRELSIVLPLKARTNFLQLEKQIGRGKPFGNFGLGQIIDFFSKTAIFSLLKNFLRGNVFDLERLNDINNFRIDQTHYDVEIVKEKVDDIREDVTNILLKLGLITRDPEEIITAKGEALEPADEQGRLKRLERLQHLVMKIRCGLLEKAIFDVLEEVIRSDGWSCYVQGKFEITGVYTGDETTVAVVRILELETPIDDPSDAYQIIIEKVREVIANIAPETKEKGSLKILLFEDYEGSGLEGSAPFMSDKDNSLIAQ